MNLVSANQTITRKATISRRRNGNAAAAPRRFIRMALASAIALAASNGFADTTWQLAAGTPGDWFNPANWSGGVPTSSTNAVIDNGGTAQIGSGSASASILYLGFSVGGTGSLTLSGGQLTPSSFEYVGYHGAGFLTQSGGTNTITGDNGLEIGASANASGLYTLSGTGSTLSVTGYERIGYNGNGNFSQSGGTNTIIIASGGDALYLGYSSGITGNYSLSGTGSLSINGPEYVGYLGAGSFTQSGGTNTITAGNGLYLANAGGTSSGTYNLSGAGSLSVSGDEQVGVNGTGTFNQSGGTHTVTGSLGIGVNSGYNGSFTLSGGTTAVGNAYVGGWSSGAAGTGVLTVSGTGSLNVGGTLTVYNAAGNRLTINEGGTITTASLNLSGNQFLLNWPMGTLAFTGSLTPSSNDIGISPTLTVGKSLQVANTLTLPSSTSLTLDGGSLTVGTLSLTGGTFNWTSGALNLTASDMIVDSGGLLGSNVTLGTGQTLQVGTFVSGGLEYIGFSGTGSINQSAGSSFARAIEVGESIGSTGVYTLSGTGSLQSNNEDIGVNGVGTFEQTGGTNNSVGTLSVPVSSGTGTYNLSAGTLTSSFVSIGGSGSGAFNQSGGTNTTASLAVASFGSYNLSGSGQISVTNMESVFGTFVQSGGVNNADTLDMFGNYSLSGGSLGVLNSGNQITGADVRGLFSQSGGSVLINQNLRITGTGSVAQYTLSGAALLTVTGNELVGTGNGPGGELTQSGGINLVFGSLLIANAGASSGIANLSGGTLTASAVAINANGSFNQSGGTLSAASLLQSAGSFIQTAGTATFGNINQSAGSFSLGGLVTLTSSSTASQMTSLTIAGTTNNWTGKLDLTSNTLILLNTSTSKAATFSTVINQITSGKNGGTWTGTGITSSAVASNANTTVALVDNAELGATTFEGQGVDSNSLIVTQALIGDVDLSGSVGFSDLLKVAQDFGQTGGWAFGHVTGGGSVGAVSFADLLLVAQNFGQSLSLLPNLNLSPQSSSLSATSVPEPGALVLFAFPFVASFARRRRRGRVCN